MSNTPRITAIVLAAGRSRRMGTSKPLLPWGDSTVLGAILRTLAAAGIPDVIVVLGPDAPAVAVAVGVPIPRVVVNPTPDAGGQIASLRLGLAAATPRGPDAILVWPADHPGVSVNLVRTLVARHAAGRPPVVRPVVGERGGHPTIFDASTFAALRGAAADQGARGVIHLVRDREARVPTDEPAAVADLDTPDDYATARPR